MCDEVLVLFQIKRNSGKELANWEEKKRGKDKFQWGKRTEIVWAKNLKGMEKYKVLDRKKDVSVQDFKNRKDLDRAVSAV